MFLDDVGYHNIAKDIVETTPILGTGYTKLSKSWLCRGFTKRTPLYPLYVAFFYRLFGVHFWPVILSQTLLDSLVIVVIYHTSKLITDSEFPAAAASLLYAINPAAIYNCTLLRTEALFMALLALSLYMFFRARSRGWAFSDTASAGFIMGLSCLVKPIIYYYPPILAASMFLDGCFRGKALKAKVVCVIILLAPFYLTVGLWQLRNLVNHGYYSLSDIQGINMCRYNALILKRHLERKTRRSQEVWFSRDVCNLKGRMGFHASSYQHKIVFAFIGDYPVDYLHLHLNALKNFFLNPISKSRGDVGRFMHNYGVIFEERGLSPSGITSLLHPLFLARLKVQALLMLVGFIYLLWWRDTRFFSLVLASAILYLANVVSVIGGLDGGRFRLPTIPMITVLAAYGLYWLAATVQRYRRPGGK